MKPRIYDSALSKDFSLDNLMGSFQKLGVSRVVFKPLAPNDNSKNQPYLAGHFTDIGFIPTQQLIASSSSSTKTSDPKRQVKFTAGLNYFWLSPDGQCFHAPTAKLIYYPQFPEVRLSGFLQGCPIDMGGWMDPSKLGRSKGRVLLFGIRGDGAIFAYLATPDSRIAKEIVHSKSILLSSVLHELRIIGRKQLTEQPELEIAETGAPYTALEDSREISEQGERAILLQELRRIHAAGPIPSKKLDANGIPKPYRARNGGGYTLEAELGVIPNGYAEPDFHGWEVKQFGVTRFELINSKPLTLMTPEPDGGIYKDEGVQRFIRQYGYSNAKIPDRYDFTGRHFSNTICEKSGLKLVLPGFDSHSMTMTDASGCIGLLDECDNIAASWSFIKLLEHWKKKHARAVYIPSISSDTADGFRSYYYGKNVRLFEGTNINLMLSAVEDKKLYYDPGIKMENASTKPKVKKRSQFRIKSKDLTVLYDELDVVDVAKL